MTNRRRSSLRGIALMGIAAAALTPQFAHAQTAPVALDIANRDLAVALTDFARQSRQQLLFSPNMVRGKRATLLRGSYIPERGLALLLTGTGLRYRTTPR